MPNDATIEIRLPQALLDALKVEAHLAASPPSAVARSILASYLRDRGRLIAHDAAEAERARAEAHRANVRRHATERSKHR
jgi:hypothetical protein